MSANCGAGERRGGEGRVEINRADGRTPRRMRVAQLSKTLCGSNAVYPWTE